MGLDKSWKLENITQSNDNQLKTPKHDKICLWIGTQKNFINVLYLTGVLKEETRFANKQSSYTTECPNIRREQFCNSTCLITNKIFKNKCEIELSHFQKITNPKMKNCPYYKEAETTFKEFLKLAKEYPKNNLTIQWEKPIKQNGFVVGIPDFTFFITQLETQGENINFYGTQKSKSYDNEVEGLIEVKPTIDSVGAVMRQLQIYRSYYKNAKIILVTVTPEYKEVFESQGFYYFIYNEEKNKTKQKTL